ncbi:MAG TPA: hypothetical protein VLL27_09645 [Solirubrobacterales bacterium]|nr:hypothetical protein [Solirubrobacterales bacterium]
MLAFALVVISVLALPAVASASTYLVNSLGDEYSPYGCEDFDECTLRTAISKSNEDEEEDTIEFEVEGTIVLDHEPLPGIFHPLRIDATTIDGYAGQPLVAIDGNDAFSEGATEGLSFLFGSGGSRAEGLAIGGFDYGVRMAGDTPIWLCNSYVGVGLDGTSAFPNETGVLSDGHGNRIGAECSAGGNLISGNDGYGVVDVGQHTVISDNRIGIDAAGGALPNGPTGGAAAGILVGGGAEEPFIGGSGGDEGSPPNVIAFNEGLGVLIEDSASNATIRRNSIHGNSVAAIQISGGAKPPVPQVEFSKVEAGGAEAFGTINGEPEESYLVDVFASASCYPDSGEGEAFLGEAFVTTDADGFGIFFADELDEPPAGQEYFSATATSVVTGATSAIGLCIDQPPDTQITSSPGNPTASGDATFTFTGNDFNGSVAGFQCSLDAGFFESCTSPQEYSGLDNGSHTFEVRAVDKSGTSDFTPAAYTWTVDTTAPSVTLLGTPPNPSNQSSGTFEFSVEDSGGSGLKGTECRLDGAPLAACSSPVNYGPLADGPQVFEVSASDNAGNTAGETFNWTIDTAAPTTTIDTNPPATSASATASFTFSGADPGGTGVSGFECKLDAGTFEICATPQEFTGLPDGSHSFEVRAIDAASNVDATPASYVWTVDTTAPTTTIDTKPSSSSADPSPPFTFSGADPGGSGVASFECKLDAGAFATCSSPKSLSGLADGTHTFEVRAKDNAGNTDASPAAYTWTVDTTAPSITLSTPPNPSNQTSATFEFSATDPGGSGIQKTECRLDSAPLTACSSPVNYSSLGDGAHVFEVQATDNAGNLDNETFSWTLDATAPTTAIDTKPADPSNETGPSFSFSGADGSGTGVAGFECKLDAGLFAACTSPKALAGLGDGNHTFEVRVKDNAGNVDASPATYSWAVDTSVPSPPVLTSTNPASPADNDSPLVIGSADAGTTVALYSSADCAPGTEVTTTATPADLEAGIPVTVAADSVTEFSATATSVALNTSACSTPIAYREDSTPPEAQIESPTPAPSSKSNSVSFFFGGGDPEGSGVARFECSLDGGAFAACTSPKSYEGLGDGSHTFEVRAVDGAGNADPTPDTYTWKVDTAATPQAQPLVLPGGPEPSNGESVAVAPEGGKVFVLRPGQKKPTELKEGQTIPVGSIVDATNGKVLLTSVNAAGETQSAVFYGGKFLIQQHDGSGLVILKLRGGDLTSCGGEARKSGATISGRKGRKLWGSGHGNFRTEGSYGSATVRGTIWFTEDRCTGTFFKTRRGVVTVRDFVNDKTISLPAGKTYFAQP